MTTKSVCSCAYYVCLCLQGEGPGTSPETGPGNEGASEVRGIEEEVMHQFTTNERMLCHSSRFSLVFMK